ncbi:hypothetical protein IAE35_06345 [Pseudomonas sp. S75]|uniref:hypothetical protein n=1 Tax=unclassified Pseudomonas TaxID=196821 RepID=UPI0019037F48|nr:MULTISPECIES: hypothetical protein [unclassified Pseudomonas]MBJ9975117.1 hypothetical protein [Pseudomonas sp. S30]MBK0152954.1 hypothetical protein [Pseudomonas sp. S75]
MNDDIDTGTDTDQASSLDRDLALYNQRFEAVPEPSDSVPMLGAPAEYGSPSSPMSPEAPSAPSYPGTPMAPQAPSDPSGLASPLPPQAPSDHSSDLSMLGSPMDDQGAPDDSLPTGRPSASPMMSSRMVASPMSVSSMSAGPAGAMFQSLSPIYIPGYIAPVKSAPPSAVGINHKMISYNPSGLLILVQAYNNMRVGDWIEVFWNDPGVSVASMLVGEGRIGKNNPLFIAASRVPEGQSQLWYRIKRVGGIEEESMRLTVVSRVTLLRDLPPPVADLPAAGFIGSDEASNGVTVRIPAYPGIHQYDRLEVVWGQESLEHIVTQAEVTAGVKLTVDENTILSAGSSDSLALAYRVTDELNNASEGWSQRAVVPVRLQDDLLRAPYIANPDPDAAAREVIDLDVLGGEDLQVEVDTFDPSFKLNDAIEVTLIGIPSQGAQVSVSPPAQPIRRLGRTLFFDIDNAALQSLRGGRATASYANLTRPGQVASRDFASFAGAQEVGVRPLLLEAAADNSVEPSLASVSVQIPAAAQLQRGDKVILTWLGTRSGGGPVYEQFTKVVSAKEAGQPLVFTISDGPRYLAPLDGGILDLGFQVQRRNVPLPIYSLHTNLQVGQPHVALPAAHLDTELANGKLDPKQFDHDVKVLIEPFFNMNEAQDVYLQWQPEFGQPWEDDAVVWPGEPLEFEIPHDQLLANYGGTVQVRYFVVEPGQPERYSDYLEFAIGQSQLTDLDPPEIAAAEGDELDPSAVTEGALILIPASAQLQAGDGVEVFWNGSEADGVTSVFEYVLEDGVSPDTLVIDHNFVVANLGGSVNVHYDVTRLSGLTDSSTLATFFVNRGGLPQAYFVEAVEGNLNPSAVLQSASVRIGADARLNAADNVRVWLDDETSNARQHFDVTISSDEAGKALTVSIPATAIQALEGTVVNLHYDIERGSPASIESGPGQRYAIKRQVDNGTLSVFGARYSAACYRASSTSRLMGAFDAITRKPILAEWRYEGDAQGHISYTWLDRQPERPLRVRSGTDALWLNPANVIGTGQSDTVDGKAAFTAMLDTSIAGAYRLCGWGSPAAGGALPATMLGHNNVAEVSATCSAFAARLNNGSVICWGNTAEGGAFPVALQGKIFTEVRSTRHAFAGRTQVTPGKASGGVSAWGHASYGGAVPASVASLTDIDALFFNARVFIVKREDGRLIAWGDATGGATLPAALAAPPASPEKKVIHVKGNFSAFVARLTDKSLVAWGSVGYGGTLPAAIASRRDIESLESATARAFTVLTSKGQVLAWGADTHGGTVPPAVALLDDILEVTSTWYAFCARRRNGHVVAWGDQPSGGSLPASVASLSNVVQVVGSAWSFAALCSDGSVVAWGSAKSGGTIPADVKARLIDVRAIYANSNSFTALTADGRTVTWGHQSGGGNSASVQAELRKGLRYGRPDSSGLVPVAADNDLRSRT